MAQMLKIVKIGNSRGVRLPATMLARYRIGGEVSVEANPDGILLRPVKESRLSWEETFKEMAAEAKSAGDEFADMEKNTVTDGLDQLDR